MATLVLMLTGFLATLGLASSLAWSVVAWKLRTPEETPRNLEKPR